MSRAETLAGLTEAIAPHDDWRFHSDEAWSCRCGEPLIVPEGLVRPVHRAHIAAAALAWLEGHGWGPTVFDAKDAGGMPPNPYRTPFETGEDA